MTQKQGVIIGLVAGAAAWAFVNGYLSFTPAPIMASGMAALLAGLLFMLAVLMMIISAFKGRSVFSPTTDGFIYGFVGAFDIAYMLGQLQAGKLPIP